MFASIDEVQQRLSECKYLTDRGVATIIYLAIKLQKPLLVEGPAGVGKTELAKVIAQATDSRLIRLQCYEGLDESKALYEWNYQKQLLRLHIDQVQNKSWIEAKQDIFTSEFMLSRPLLEALLSEERVVLLIDEVDKSDEEFESFLLEILSDYQVTIPELGTIKANSIPIVVLTSNSFREFGDALKRRCIHLYLDYPSFERELEIVHLKCPGIQQALGQQVVRFVQNIRKQKLKKAPSISETLDWARALLSMGASFIDEEIIRNTLSILLKYQSDIEKIAPKISSFIPE
jgi:MoxR-like ATPase